MIPATPAKIDLFRKLIETPYRFLNVLVRIKTLMHSSTSAFLCQSHLTNTSYAQTLEI